MSSGKIDFTFTPTGDEHDEGWRELAVDVRDQEGVTFANGRIQVQELETGTSVDLGQDFPEDTIDPELLLAGLNSYLAS